MSRAPLPSERSTLFRAGDHVQLTGSTGKRNTIILVVGGVSHTHRGAIEHDALIGLPEGSVVRNSAGAEHLALRPQLADFVMSMPRGAAIVYPKDAAQIIAQADIFPGAIVVEAGVGSGALSLWLLRAIGPTGRLESFERREEFATIAENNVAAFVGCNPTNWRVTRGDLVESLSSLVPAGSVDRVVLDMLAPWECVGAAARVLVPGGVFACYVATVTQLSRTAERVRSTAEFTTPESTEVMIRNWHVEGLAVRPEHRMIGHTGFVMTARRLAPNTVLPPSRRRTSKTAFSDDDVELWTPGALGEREMSAKSVRKRVRDASARANSSTVHKKSTDPSPDGDTKIA